MNVPNLNRTPACVAFLVMVLLEKVIATMTLSLTTLDLSSCGVLGT
jgi:hypothetical protein